MQLPTPDEALSFEVCQVAHTSRPTTSCTIQHTYLSPTSGSISALHPDRKCKHAVPPKNLPTTHIKRKKKEEKKKNRLRPERLPFPQRTIPILSQTRSGPCAALRSLPSGTATCMRCRCRCGACSTTCPPPFPQIVLTTWAAYTSARVHVNATREHHAAQPAALHHSSIKHS